MWASTVSAGGECIPVYLLPEDQKSSKEAI